VLFGIGPALAGPYSQMFDRFIMQSAAGVVPNFKVIWWTQSGIAAACALIVAMFFRAGKTQSSVSMVEMSLVEPAE
jgi:hypothetical protein